MTLGNFVSATYVAGLLVMSSMTAIAAPIELDIDFRDDTVWGGAGTGSFTADGITVTANGDLLYRDNIDGYGILGGEQDEIDRDEILSVLFDAALYVNPDNWLTGVLLTDLFPANDGGNAGESGWVRLYDSAGGLIQQFLVHATSYDPNGEYYVNFGGSFNPAYVDFLAYVDQFGQHTGSEFSVAGFATVAVPEPGMLALLGAGLLLLAGLRKRQQPVYQPRGPGSSRSRR